MKNINVEEKSFMEKHGKKILIGAGVVAVGGLAYLGFKQRSVIGKQNWGIVKNHEKIEKLTTLAKNSLTRELSRCKFEIEELKNSIERLDVTKNINKFTRIPEREARIAELIIQVQEITSKLNECE